MGKRRGGWTVKRLLVAIVPCAMAICMPSPVLAATRQVEVTVCVAEILSVNYTGCPVIQFNVNRNDLVEGSMTLLDQGDVKWGSNAPLWVIKVQRTEWQTPDKSDDKSLILLIKYGPGSGGAWVTVNTTPTTWITGVEPGTGTLQGVDWKVKGLLPKMKPGKYYCTVTITIIGGG